MLNVKTIGTFRIISGNMVVSDPIYDWVDISEDKGHVLTNVKCGEWIATVSIDGGDVNELTAYHIRNVNITGFEPVYKGNVRTEVGAVGFFDYSAFDAISQENLDIIKSDIENEWKFNSSLMPNSVVSLAGFGEKNQSYNILQITDNNGDVIAVKIIFINSDEYKCEWDFDDEGFY